MKPTKSLLALTAAIIVTGCSSTSTETSNASSQVSTQNAVLLTDDQITQRLIGNTLIGETAHFKSAVGTIQFKIHYAPDGTVSDHLTYPKTRRSDTDTGIWRIKDAEQGIVCTQSQTRRSGNEHCSKFYATQDGNFRSEPVDQVAIPLQGKIVSGDQTQ